MRSDPAPGVDADVLELLATPGAAGASRRHVRGLLSGNGCSPDDLDLAVLLVSELVTNAVLHGSAPIVLRLTHWEASLRVEVDDAGTCLGPAEAGGWDLTAEGGRGLALVEALATSWGSVAHGGLSTGKTVWFEIIGRVPQPAVTG